MTMGIDFGTTNSRVSMFVDGSPKVILNEFGKSFIPSIVSFENGNINVGQFDHNSKLINPYNIIYDIKKIIGKRFEEEEIQVLREELPFIIKQGSGTNEGLLVIEIDEGNRKKKEFLPEEILSFIFKKLKEIANTTMKTNKAVITVPSYFNYSQREAVLKAAELADIQVQKLVEEPIAAAIAYNYYYNSFKGKTVLVYDSGGGKTEVSILKFNETQNDKLDYQILATSSDIHLGGEDLDQCIFKHFNEKFKLKIDKLQDKIAKQAILNAAEESKIKLSQEMQTLVEFTFKDNHYSVPFERGRFELICDDILSNELRLTNLFKKYAQNNYFHIIITYEVDENGKLNVSAELDFNGEQHPLELKLETNINKHMIFNKY